METRSKTRVGPGPDPDAGQARSRLPGELQSGSSTDASLNLTVVLGDGVARVVGASSPEVGLPARLPGITSSEQARETAEVSAVTEPICLRGSLSEKMVEPRTPTYVQYLYFGFFIF